MLRKATCLWLYKRVYANSTCAVHTHKHTHTHKAASLRRQIKVELWAQEAGQMERAASLGHSITESMFVRMCVPERMCLLKWDVMLSSASSRYSVRTCDLEKQTTLIHVFTWEEWGFPCLCVSAYSHMPQQMHREWKGDRPFKQD